MDLDNHQKGHIAEGFKNCNKDDVVIISDLDEIPSAEMVSRYADDTTQVHVFAQYFSNYYANYIAVEGPVEEAFYHTDNFVFWKGSVMLPYDKFRNVKKSRLLRELGED